MLVMPRSRLFKMFCFLCRKEQFYHFRPRDSPMVVGLPRVKKWKDRFVRMKRPSSIGVGMRWWIASEGPNQMHEASLAKQVLQKDREQTFFDELRGG